VANISLTLPLLALVLAGVGAIDTKIAFGSCNKQVRGRGVCEYLIYADCIVQDVVCWCMSECMRECMSE
jgi:hypothetical protein